MWELIKFENTANKWFSFVENTKNSTSWYRGGLVIIKLTFSFQHLMLNSFVMWKQLRTTCTMYVHDTKDAQNLLKLAANNNTWFML